MFPSRSVTAWSKSFTIGSKSRNRQTPLWSIESVELRRSCHNHRSALAFGSRAASTPAFTPRDTIPDKLPDGAGTALHG